MKGNRGQTDTASGDKGKGADVFRYGEHGRRGKEERGDRRRSSYGGEECSVQAGWLRGWRAE